MNNQERYILQDNKRLRRGYTTGSCAAAAAQGAARLLLGEPQGQVVSAKMDTPKGISLNLKLLEQQLGEGWASCAVQKDSGDDPDVTDGALVYAKVSFLKGEPATVAIDGGLGIGRVTKPGLACAVGQAAINPTPRKMIEQQVRLVMEQFGYEDGLAVEISIPDGVALAKKTFNPKLGIEGGISVLGTSGIVEPMSEQALIDTIKVEMNMRKAAGEAYLILTPGNYGETFLQEEMGLDKSCGVKYSNFVGAALDYAGVCGFRGILMVGHIGKLVKVAGGAMNTHSKYGDNRMRLIAECCREQGAGEETVKEITASMTTEDAVSIMDRAGDGLRQRVIDSLLVQIMEKLRGRLGGGIEIQVILYSNHHGRLGETAGAKELLARIKAERKG